MIVPVGDRARVSVFVAVPLQEAFEVFTEQIDAWWRTGRAYRIAGRRRGQLVFEAGLGGRLFETFEAPSGTRTFEVGKVTAWEPPNRIELEWRGVNFKPHESTVVEVTFSPTGDGTTVTVVHRGWAALPDDHPARHGRTGTDFTRTMGMWWGALLTSLREHVAARAS
jgi:uncharacterized protein YndB with AHSA1/START domain